MPGAPAVIAHRGASAYLPEHSLVAKSFAHALGADYLEQDVVSTRDGVLVVLHDIYLDDVTDVATVFPGRQRDNGRSYVIDFDLSELRQLGIMERRNPDRDEALFPGRFPRGGVKFPITTLDEELSFIQGLNRSTGRSAGIYPEIKDPEWHFANNIDLSHLLLTTLESYGFTESSHDAIVQCFDAVELRRVREQLGCRLKLTQLLDGDADLSVPALAEVAEYANGVGLPFMALLTPPDAAGEAIGVNDVAANARAAGLFVHPYTFRADRLPTFVDDADELLELLFERVMIDGLFCDHPDIALAARDAP